MAKKLSPLVLPVVVDTSGVDKGVNNIRSKLSRVRGQGAGGGGIGGSGGGFSSGVTPFGVNIGGSGSAAAAMAAAFGAALGRNEPGALIGRDPAVSKMGYKERDAFRRSSMVGNWVMGWSDRAKAKSQEYAEANRKLKEAEKSMPWRDSWMRKSNPERLENQRKYELYNRMRDRLNIVATNATNITRGVQAQFNERENLGTVLGAAYAGARTLQALSPVGIQSTLGNLKPFETRAAGQYDIAQGMRNRAMTATEGNLTMGQQFLLGAGTAAGGGVTRTEQMGAGLYEGLGTVAATAGSALEQTLSAGVGAVEGFLQRAAIGGYLSNPFNYIRRIMN